MTNQRIYLDYNATTPVDRDMLEARLPYFTEVFGNAASNDHEFGLEAKRAVDKTRQKVVTNYTNPDEFTRIALWQFGEIRAIRDCIELLCTRRRQ
jgi:cysteine desulfurase